jgi:acetyltransferase
LEALFDPKSVAVVGASRSPGKLGHILAKNLVEYRFPGPIYPVNPEGGEILGLKAYPRVTEIPDKVELALISVPAARVVEAVADCAQAGVSVAVVLSSGFGEAGETGRESQLKIRELIQAKGLRLLGPNCMGVYNIQAKLNGTYFWELPRLAGNVSFLSQSGAYGGILFAEATKQGLGVSKFVSIGNQLDIGFPDLLEYLGRDDTTDLLALFIEEIKEGQEFLRVVERVVRVKPVVALKAGRSEAGDRAARSHTGSLAGSWEVYKAACRQAGVILAQETDQFFDLCRTLSRWRNSLPKDNRVAVATISGGPCVIASDTCEEVGLKVPRLEEHTKRELRRYLPFFGADGNPVDMTPQMADENYQPCLEVLGRAEEISGIIAINVGLDKPEFAQGVISAQQIEEKPVVALVIAAPAVASELAQADIPVFPTPERAVRAYQGLVPYRDFLDRVEESWPEPGPPSQELARLAGEGVDCLDEYETKRLLKEHGIPVIDEQVVEGMEDALPIASRLGYPVVVKVLAGGLTHKTEAGGVFMNIESDSALEQAIAAIKDKFPTASILLQRQASPGMEIIIGAKRDQAFGPVVAFGLGGIWTEVLKDVALRVAPLKRVDAQEMIREGIRAYRCQS